MTWDQEQPAIRIIPLVLGPIETNCYIVAGPGSEEAVLIDPVDSAETITRAVEGAGLRIARILLTHGHCDHILALAEMKRRTGAPAGIHPADEGMLTDAEANGAAMIGLPYEPATADFLIADGDSLRVGDLTLKALHTPGHSPGGMSFWVEPRSEAPGVVFCGDALFQGSIGRTDLPGGDYETLIASIRVKLLSLPDETIALSGHGPATTIGRERQNNPFLQHGARGAG